MTRPATTQALRVSAKASDAAALPASLRVATTPLAPGEVVVEVRSAGVNPSDAKAVLGLMPQAVWPRTPGRDFAGVVVDGPAALLGREVWGSGGELGIERDGSHAGHLVLPAAAVRPKPVRLSLLEAGAVGVPFITAAEGLREAGGVRPGDVVLACGANGKVGQAVLQLAAQAGAHVFGVARGSRAYQGWCSAPVTMLDAAGDWAAALRGHTGGHGADIVFNTVGSPFFAMANAAMAKGGRQIFIATIDRAVPFDIFAFYRGGHRYFGVDSLALDSTACAAILAGLAPGFESGALRPFPVAAADIFPLGDAAAAYQRVLSGAVPRVVLAAQGAPR